MAPPRQSKQDGERELRRGRNRKLSVIIVSSMAVGYAVVAYIFICMVSVTPETKEVAKVKPGTRVDLFVTAPESLSSDDYREAALAWERQRIAEDEARERVVDASPRVPYNRWYEKVQQLESQLQEFEEFPEDSIQWHMKKSLEKLQEDKPER